jgi:hypothetical protein
VDHFFKPSLKRALFAGGLCFWIFSLVPLEARADLTIVQQTEGAGASGEMLIRIRGNKMRSDLTARLTMILDGDTGETFFLHHADQTFSRVTAEEAKHMGERFGEAQSGSEAGKLFATGEKKMIGSHLAELYLWTIGAMKMRLWIAHDFPNGQAVQAQLDRLQRVGLASATANLMPPAGSVPGLRLRTEIELKGQKLAYTILSVKEEPLDAAQFSIPPEYRETPFAFPAKPTE